MGFFLESEVELHLMLDPFSGIQQKATQLIIISTSESVFWLKSKGSE